MKVYGKAGFGDVFSEKPRKDKIQIAQGKRSRMMRVENQQRVWMLIGERGYLTFSQLQKATGLCRQSLAKILRELKEDGSVVKDTVKPWEQFEHWKIISSPIDAFWHALKKPPSENVLTGIGRTFTGSAVEAWLLRLVSVKPQHVGEIVYRIT